MKKQFKYYTFISYKHEQKANGKFTTDEKWAHIFKSHLESWEIPAHIPSQERLNEEDERIYPVFRDSENYPVSGELNQLTHKSLSESKTLLVILSREMLEDQFKLRYKHGANAWIFNEIESFIDLGNNSESIILFYVGDDDINPNELLKEMIELCENKGIECKALKYMYQPNKIIKRLRDFKDKGNEIEHYATAVVAAGIFNTDPYFFIDAYELAERKKKIVSQKEFTMENGYKYQIFDSESVFLISVPSVSEVAIPNIVEYEGFKFDVIGIGEGAFYGTSLESLFIPQSIQHILCDTLLAFQDSLQKIIVEPGNLKYDSRNNCNAIIETKTNSFLFGCKTSVIPEGIISIAPKAFEHCTLLKSINIPASVKEIGAGAFKNCINLTSISIPDNITRIEDNTFYGCVSLESINLPESLKFLPEYVFIDCESLKEINIPKSLVNIEAKAFPSGPSLKSINVNPANVRYDSRCNCNAIIETETNRLILASETTIILDSVISIGDSAFYGSSLSTIILPNSIRKIESGAFSNFSSLVNIIIPNSVTNIGSNAFFNCPSLESVTISKNVKNIGDHAFSNCPSLDNIYYQGSIEQWKLLQEGWWWKAEIPRTIVHCNDGDWEI